MTVSGLGIRRERKFRPGLILALVSGVQFMVVLDLAVVNVALPSIKFDLGLAQADLQWVVVTYGLTLGGFLLLGGRAADLIGRRRLLVAGLGLFTIASLTAGLADSLGVLVVSRALQGLGAAMAAPAAPSILTSTFEEGPSRNKALGIFGGFLSIVYGISESATSGWTSAGTIGFLAGGVVLLVAFLAIESRAAFPLMPLSMLRRGTLNAANVVAALMFGSFLGFVLQANLLIQHGFGYSAIATGLAWMATSLTALTAASVVAPRLLTRIGPGRTLVIGQATAVAGLMSLARTPAEAEYWRDLFPGLLAMGIAIGLSAVAVQVAAFIGIDGGVRGLAGGMLETAREVGGALGTAVLAAVAVAASGDVIGGASADSAGATALTAGLVLRRAERAAETGQPVPEPELEVGS